MRTRVVLGIAGITLLGALLRFWLLGAQSLWLDELFSVMLARRDWSSIVAGTLADTQPPLYYLLLHPFLQIGQDETAARLISALFSTAAIPLSFALARRLVSRGGAFLAALFVATSPFQVAYGQEARMYAQLAFFQLAGVYFLLRAWDERRAVFWILFVVVECISLYTHSLAILGLVALDVWALVQGTEVRARWRELLLAHAAIALLFAPWLAALASQTARVLAGFWNAPSTLLNLVRTYYVLIFGTSLPTLLVPIGLLLVLFVFSLALVHAARTLLTKDLAVAERRGISLILALTLVPPLALFLLSMVRPIYVERVVILSSFGMILLLAWAFAERAQRMEKALAGGIAVLLLVGLGNYYLHPETQKPPMRDAAQALIARVQPGDVVAHTSDWSALAFAYYLPQSQQHFVEGDPAYTQPTTRGNSGRIAGLNPELKEAILQGHERLWLVVALDHSEDYQRATVSELDQTLTRLETIDIQGIYLLLYPLSRN